MVAVRFQDINNMIVFSWVRFECAWYVVKNGKWEMVPNSNIRSTSIGRMSISARGNKFSAYVNGESIVSFFDDNFATGMVGLRVAAKSTVDDFVIRP